MKKLTFVSVVMLILSASCAWAETATESEALNMAQNWVTRVITNFGGWGGSAQAKVVGIQPFMRGDRQLGYFCPVEPRGYLVVSLYKELAPVKAYSETDTLDPKSDEGMADIIKGGLERMINAAERRVGKMASPATMDLSAIVEIDYKPVWSQLAVKPAVYSAVSEPAEILANYQEGQTLLTSAWHQAWPYNDQCRLGDWDFELGQWVPCADPDQHGHVLVGCVATAGAQIMRYWCWPPSRVDDSADPYDWPNTPGTVTGASPAAEIDAVAELCHEVGVACDMDYGCDASSAYNYNWFYRDMIDAYEEDFRYSPSAEIAYRDDWTAVEWFDRMKAQFNVNRPVQYGIPAHSLVSDGWRETGDPVVREHHMNYGWRNTNYNTWYVLDALHDGDPDEEEMIRGIRPLNCFDGVVSGAYPLPELPYGYVDQDATCSDSAAFASGYNLQFLPNATLTCTSTTDSLRIYGTGSENTRLFTRGDPSRGVHIVGSAIKMSHGGTVVFR